MHELSSQYLTPALILNAMAAENYDYSFGSELTQRRINSVAYSLNQRPQVLLVCCAGSLLLPDVSTV